MNYLLTLLFRTFMRCVSVLLLFVCLYALAALLGALHFTKNNDKQAFSEQVVIGLLQGPIHYDLLLPLNDTTRSYFEWIRQSGVAIDHPQAKWMIVGWGAEGFYTNTGTYSDLTLESAIHAIFGDRSVMRVDLAGPIDESAPVHWISLNNSNFQQLLKSVTNSFEDGANTKALAIDGFNDHDRFFPAKGQFHLFQTCNVWIGKMMRASNVPFGRWTPTPYAVTLSHRLGTN